MQPIYAVEWLPVRAETFEYVQDEANSLEEAHKLATELFAKGEAHPNYDIVIYLWNSETDTAVIRVRWDAHTHGSFAASQPT